MFARARLLLFCLAACLCGALLHGCGGGGGAPGAQSSPAAPAPVPGPAPAPVPVTTGTLAISVAGLPEGAAAAVRVTGPGGFAQSLTQSQTLAGLAPGSYTVSASGVGVGSTSWTPAPATQTLAVTAGATASASVVYGAGTLALDVLEVATADNPTFVTAPPGDTRLFVVERAGRVRIFQRGAFLTQPFLDVHEQVLTSGEGGLLSLAFDPAFASNGYVYLYYTGLDQNIRVDRLRVSPNPNVADPTSALPVIRIAHPVFQNHYGGLLAFGPDGLLYLGTGDGGGAGDPAGNGQNLNTLLGKMLRIDVRGATFAQPYTVAPSNPYAGQAGRRGEIWASGLRNPWRFAFDAGQLYIADVGQDRREEIDVASTGGLNFGWNITEGMLCYNAPTCDLTGLTAPVFDYDHGSDDTAGCAITGGYVYRGAALPELAGRYLYSDYCAGFLKSVLVTGAGAAEARDWGIGGLGSIVSFGQDGQGELYLVGGSGKIYRIVRAAAPSR